jgi:hypothetical protein
MFADLWRHQDPHYVAMRNEVMVDLMKIDALDLATRVCRDNHIRIAFDRMPSLRHALDLMMLRFQQIERSLATEPRRKPPSAAEGPGGLHHVAADTATIGSSRERVLAAATPGTPS